MIDFGVDQAVGEFVCILNGDNTVDPQYVAEMYADADIVTCQVWMHDLPGIILSGRGWVRGRIDRLNYAVRRCIARRVRHQMHLDADHDYLMDCWTEANRREPVVVHHVDKVLGHHR